jgi:hypothetical protein
MPKIRGAEPTLGLRAACCRSVATACRGVHRTRQQADGRKAAAGCTQSMAAALLPRPAVESTGPVSRLTDGKRQRAARSPWLPLCCHGLPWSPPTRQQADGRKAAAGCTQSMAAALLPRPAVESTGPASRLAEGKRQRAAAVHGLRFVATACRGVHPTRQQADGRKAAAGCRSPRAAAFLPRPAVANPPHGCSGIE